MMLLHMIGKISSRNNATIISSITTIIMETKATYNRNNNGDLVNYRLSTCKGLGMLCTFSSACLNPHCKTHKQQVKKKYSN